MKFLIINLLVIVIYVHSDATKQFIRPQLPLGEYNIKMLAVLPCESIKTNGLIELNFYLTKISNNNSEIKGNVTYHVPLDDTLNIEIDLAVKNSIGGWRENDHIFKTPKACSTFRRILGNDWSKMTESFGIHNSTGCPIPPGVYVVTYNPHEQVFFKRPKKFFYGTYKHRFMYTKNNEIYGCSIFVIEVKRPWEDD